MQDLINRLRNSRSCDDLCDEAAENIENLEAENAALRSELDAVREQKPVAWGIAETEQIFFGGPDAKPFANAWKPLYAAPGASPQPVQVRELSQKEAEELAHRRASKYAHRSDPSYVAYTFLPHTLMDFVRDIIAAINAKGDLS